MKSHRAVVALVTIVLALATALTLVGTAVTLADAPAAADPADDNLAVVRRFYAAVNAALATGDLAALDAVVSPALAVGFPGRAGSGDLASLRDHLRALHAVRPGLWIRVEEAIAGRDQVVTRPVFDGLAGDRERPGGPLAVPAPDSPAWAAGDRFRIDGGRIVAYEGITLALGAPRAALDVEVALPALGQGRLGLARLTVAPWARADAPAATGPAVYLVEAGMVALRLTDETGAAGEERRLVAGDRFQVAAGTIVSLRNPAAKPAVLLTAGVTVADAPWPPRFWPPIEPPTTIAPTAEEAMTHALPMPAADPVPTVPPQAVEAVSLGGAAISPAWLNLTGNVRLAIARLEPAAERNVLDLADGGPTLLAVETGQALIDWPAGAAGLVVPEATAVAAPAGVLPAGQAALAEPGASLTVQPAGDQALTLLLLTIAPA